MLTPEEWSVLALSVSVAGRAVLVGLPIALAIGWTMARTRFPGRTLIDAVLHSSLFLPPVVVGLVLIVLFGADAPVGKALAGVGIRLIFTANGAALAAGVMAFPLMLRACRQAIESVDARLDDVAASLGASFWDRMFSVTLPLAAPGLIAAAVIGFAAALGEFGAVITFAANIPGETQTLALAIYAALQQPGGEAIALRLAGISFTVAIAALLLSEALLAYGRKRAGA